MIQVLLVVTMSVRALLTFLVIFQTAVFAHSLRSDFTPTGLADRTVCGMQSEQQDRIVGGEMADKGEFPWMAAIEYVVKRNESISAGIKCGGSLINNRFVLTAAHCIQHREFKPIKVWLGAYNITSDEHDCLEYAATEECSEDVLKLNIIQEIPHPHYTQGQGTSDIGLLRLERDTYYTDLIRPICLPLPNSKVPPSGTIMTAAGWGDTKNATKKFSDILMKVDIHLLANENCTLKTNERVSSASQLCAGGKKLKDACQGDSGGPLIRKFEDEVSMQTQWYQEGVVSYGKGCVGRPAVYTRVSRFMGWIENNIAEE